MNNQSTEQRREEQQNVRSFHPNDHLIQLKSRDGSKDYLPVQWRLVWFRDLCPQGTIDTEEVEVDLDREVEAEAFVWNNEKRRSERVVKHAKGYARFRTIVTDGKGGRATGTKSENAANFPDFIEKAETGSIGRALAALGYGTQFTGDEFHEEHRIVDSPVERQPTAVAANGNGYNNGNAPLASVRPATPMNGANSSNGPSTQPVPQPINTPRQLEPADEAAITEQQVSSIRKLCEHLGKAEPDNVTSISYLSAKKLIQQLTTEYKESRQSKKAS